MESKFEKMVLDFMSKHESFNVRVMLSVPILDIRDHHLLRHSLDALRSRSFPLHRPQLPDDPFGLMVRSARNSA